MIDSSEFLKGLFKNPQSPPLEKPEKSKASRPGSAYRFALRSLSAAGASKKRLQERMERKGFSAQEIEEAVLELERLGFLNDAALAQELAEKAARAMEGEPLIRLRLRRAGIGENDALRALELAEPLIEEGREKFISLLRVECGPDVKKAVKLCRKKGQPLGLAFRGASYTPGSVAP